MDKGLLLVKLIKIMQIQFWVQQINDCVIFKILYIDFVIVKQSNYHISILKDSTKIVLTEYKVKMDILEVSKHNYGNI